MKHSAKSNLTKNALSDSLKKAIMFKPIHKITIKEIVEDTGFNRQTFYYHFNDIFHLLSWTLDRELLSVILNNEKFSSWQEAGIYTLTYLKNNQELSMCLINAKGSPSLQKFFYDNAQHIVKIFLKSHTDNANVPKEHIEALTHFYKITFASLLEDWITTGMEKEPKKVISILDMIVSGTASTALSRFSKSNCFSPTV